MRMSHFSKEFCNKLVLCHNVIKELTLASALFWVSIPSHISFRESDLTLPNQLSLLQSSIYSLLAAWVAGSALIPTYPFGSIQLHCLSLALASAFGHLPMQPHTPPSTPGIQELYSIKSVRLGIILLTRFRIVLKKKKRESFHSQRILCSTSQRDAQTQGLRLTLLSHSTSRKQSSLGLGWFCV